MNSPIFHRNSGNPDLPTPEQLFPATQLAERVHELGKQITADFQGCPLTVVSISNGAMIFTADLIREIKLPLCLDSVMASSYSGTESSGRVEICSTLKTIIENRCVLLLDDILDTGRTLVRLREMLLAANPCEFRSCVLLDKPARRVIEFTADYVGFEIDDIFVVGYGLDYEEYYRNLPYVGFFPDGNLP